MRLPDETRTYCRKNQLHWDVRNWTIGPRFRLVRTFDLAPLQGASLLVVDSQG